MNADQPIVLRRDCRAVMIPTGKETMLPSGSSVWLTQTLGGAFTVLTDRGYSVRIEGEDGDALGLDRPANPPAPAEASTTRGAVEEQVWRQLRSCFDPEIPVNIVELGLIYDCRVEELADGGYGARIRFTLTSPGCGMGHFFKEDIRKRLLSIPGVQDAEVELVWEPPWNQSMMSAVAKHQLGIE